MKAGAYIILLMMSFFTIQPVLPVAEQSHVNECCSKRHCKKPAPVKNKKDKCEGMSCNPFVGCPYYNLFLVNRPAASIFFILSKEKIMVRNDNRTVQNDFVFWHPPNVKS
ncbi:MAG: hypothetical protein ABIO04_01565 [Ferruginibacter sp.]